LKVVKFFLASCKADFITSLISRYVACELKVFDALERGPLTVDAIAAEVRQKIPRNNVANYIIVKSRGI
jgi:hypothetical protein